MLAAAVEKESESLNDLLTEVIAVRRAAKPEYERKLKKFYAKRANQMQNNVFDGVELPEIKYDKYALKESIRKNQELVEKAQSNIEQYSYAKGNQQRINDELKEMAESLQKVVEIEQAIRADGSHSSHEQYHMDSP